MNHLNDEDLLLHAYGEGNTAEVEQHLGSCGHCSKVYEALRSDLADLPFGDVPARDADYGGRVWDAIAGSLSPDEIPRVKRPPTWQRLSYLALAALLIAAAFLGGRAWEHRNNHQIAQLPADSKPAIVQTPPQPIVVVVLSSHLDRSERLLVELKHADGNNTSMATPLRDEAKRLLADNRICHQKAVKDDDARLVTALERLDRVLATLANQPGGLDTNTINRVQKEMNVEGLLFEVRVLRSQAAAANGQAKEATI